MPSWRYPGATWRPSKARHPNRDRTLGVCLHWTVGSEAGDVAVLTGGSVDCHFYVTKAGRVWQFLHPDSQSWTAMSTANRTCLHIETEGRGEAWTPAQLQAVAALTAWLCRRYGIPVRKAEPRSGVPDSFRGIFGHRDLRGIDGNDHTDTVPEGTGWPRFLEAVRTAGRAPAPRLTLAQRLRRAGFGMGSIRAVLRRLGHKEARP